MNQTQRDELKAEAIRKFQAYLQSPWIQGLFVQGWDRMRALGHDVDLRREINQANAHALLCILENKLYA